MAELHEDRRRALSFGAIADDYDRLRPRYSDVTLDAIATGGTALDVGAGTGILNAPQQAAIADVVGSGRTLRQHELVAVGQPIEVGAHAGERVPEHDAVGDAESAPSSSRSTIQPVASNFVRSTRAPAMTRRLPMSRVPIR